jgi:hypothetical protein
VVERVLPLYAATRFLTLVLALPGSAVLVAPSYFHLALTRLGPVQGLWEYPWPLAKLLQLPLAAGLTSFTAYTAGLVGFALAVDAAFCVALWRASGGSMTPGLRLWLFALPALGPIALLTFDVIPAAMAGTAVLALAARRPALAGAVVGGAAGLKVWPLVGIVALAVPGSIRGRLILLVAASAIALLLAAATLAEGGLARLWSPWIWQQGRGLQIEALAALPFLWLRYFSSAGPWTTPMTPFNAYEVKGPGVDVAVSLSTAALLLALAALAALHVRALRGAAATRTPGLAALLFVTTVSAVLVTSKVLSPQYMVWLAALAAALGTLARTSLTRVDVWGLLAACALTQAVFPLNYDALVTGSSFSVLAALTLRDACLLMLAVRFAACAWRTTNTGTPVG